MAADRPLCERRIVEIKMGRSKFPGKPSKIGNRKRVNLSNCALPEDNDSSKAAENIYLGLSVFNETFGDNEMVAPGPFHGFSMMEVEDAMAEARLQQREAETEHKNQGISIDLWEEFQTELFSIGNSSSCKSTELSLEITKTKLCYDGGGKSSQPVADETDNKCEIQTPSKTSVMAESKLLQKPPEASDKKSALRSWQLKLTSPAKKDVSVLYTNPKIKHFKSPNSKKSLQSQAAKKLLEKAKKANISETQKNSVEKKFVLPSHSAHSSRVIKPNKRFMDDEDQRMGKLLRSHSRQLLERTEAESREEEEGKKRARREEGATPEQPRPQPAAGKVILREARLQLDSSNLPLTEGPFSSSNTASLSPNTQLKVTAAQSLTVPGTVMCGVCGAVRFYRFVKQARKFGIFSCESCRKFISKLMKKQSGGKGEKRALLECRKGSGLCLVPPVVRSQHWNVVRCEYNARCQACWLKLCLRSFKMPPKMKHRLARLLPPEMRRSFTLDPAAPIASDASAKFGMGQVNMKDFKWLHENGGKDIGASWPVPAKDVDKPERKQKSLRKVRKSLRTQNEKASKLSKLSKHTGRKKVADRQQVGLKGPRVKHVCRSASVVLGQPLATFPTDAKRPPTEPAEDCQSCDVLATTGQASETQVTSDKPPATEGALTKPVAVADKKFAGAGSKAVGRPPGPMSGGSKAKKKNQPAENLISMDFWESYDPDEVWDTGFGLIGSEPVTVRALCFLCGSAGQEKLLHCASCCEPYHEFCVDESLARSQDPAAGWRHDWVCPRCTVCVACSRTSGQQLRCVRCSNSYHTECVDRVGGRLLHSPDRPWVCSACLRCKSCNGVDVSVFVGNLPLCKPCFALRQKGNYCPLCQRCYEDDDYDSKMMECGQCRCWVHAKCEGLSDEKYQVLSFLPESVEFICRMCCSMPPAPWWLAVEAELKAGYLGVLKSLSKNRKACTMLKWSPRKQCSCRQLNYVPRVLDFDEGKPSEASSEAPSDDRPRPGAVTERKTSIEVINHPTESLKLTLKIMKPSEGEEAEPCDAEPWGSMCERFNIKQCSVRVKKCLVGEEGPGEDGQGGQAGQEGQASPAELRTKRALSSPLNPASDSGIGSTDDELKASGLTDEESCRPEETAEGQKGGKSEAVETQRKPSCDAPFPFLEDRRDCFCFLEVDSYNSRSKPFSPNLLSIKKKVTTSEYSSLHQFHQDMQRMIATTQSSELMEVYHQTIKEIFPWFDPKFSRVFSNAQKPSGTVSAENTPVKATPTKHGVSETCRVPAEQLTGQPLEYYYSGVSVEDTRVCLMCKATGDGPPGETGRLLYCGQNEWVHSNCALWSGEVFEEIDGSLQNVHSAISRGRSIRCPECDLKGASIGCCARNCQETYHFPCARKVGCVFMDDKTVYCSAHASESLGKLVQNEKEFEIRRPVYVELDKRRMKTAESSMVRVSVGALRVEQLGRLVLRLSDQPEALLPAGFHCSRLFWSSVEPWRVVRYHFTIRLLEVEQVEGVDLGVNLTVDHSLRPDVLDLKLKQLRYFQEFHRLLEMEDSEAQCKVEDTPKPSNTVLAKRSVADSKAVRRVFEHLDAKDDENLSDNQNTADLLPPDIEEAILKDLPHDILDGISMQDIFMDIKNEPFENGEKDAKDEMNEDTSEVEEVSADSQPSQPNQAKPRRQVEYHADVGGEFWLLPSDVKQVTDGLDEIYKAARDLKRSKSDVMPSQPVKKTTTLRNHQRSCSLNWNCKLDGPTSKWKKNLKGHGRAASAAATTTTCDVTFNLVETQDRGNRLQELKLTDGLVAISTGSTTMDSLKARLDETRRSLQQEEGKENKCLPWHTRMQPRLLQVDGGVDSSSSGSEAGESPQRLMEDGSQRTAAPQSSPSPSASLSPYGPPYLALPPPPPPFNPHLPQMDGVADEGSDLSDSDAPVATRLSRPRPVPSRPPSTAVAADWLKMSQCDGNVDSESEGCDSPKHDSLYDDDFSLRLGANSCSADEEPVKCDQCHCTYRTKLSYQRHLENCCNDFILSSSEGEMSEEEGCKKSTEEARPAVKTPEKPVEVKTEMSPVASDGPCTPPSMDVRLEVKRARPTTKPRTYTRRKPLANEAGPTAEPLQHMVLQQPTVIVQDVQPPGLLFDPSTTLQYVVDPQTSFAKPQLIATPNPLVPGTFQLQATPEQVVLPQSIILQPPQPAPIVMAGDQMVLGSTPMFEVVQDPQTGGMFLASHNQPVLYNMETIVSNTVMQTNQFVSNVMATSSFSQTSTQVFQASKLEQVVNMPSNFIVLGPNNPVPEKIVTANDIICLQQPGSILSSHPLQLPSHSVVSSPLLHASQPFAMAEPKMPGQVGPLRAIQPCKGKPAVVGSKPLLAQAMRPSVSMVRPVQQLPPRFLYQQPVPSKPVVAAMPRLPSYSRAPVVRSTVARPAPRQYEKVAVTPKAKPRSRALVDYINNFRSDLCDTHCPTPSTPVSLSASFPAAVTTGVKFPPAVTTGVHVNANFPPVVTSGVNLSANFSPVVTSGVNHCANFPSAVTTGVKLSANFPPVVTTGVNLNPNYPPAVTTGVNLSSSYPPAVTTGVNLSPNYPPARTTGVNLSANFPSTVSTGVNIASLPKPTIPVFSPQPPSLAMPQSGRLSLTPCLPFPSAPRPPAVSTAVYTPSSKPPPLASSSPSLPPPLPVVTTTTSSPLSSFPAMHPSPTLTVSVTKSSPVAVPSPEAPVKPLLVTEQVLYHSPVPVESPSGTMVPRQQDDPEPISFKSLSPVPYDQELKLSINMPSLDDSPPPSLATSPRVANESGAKKESPACVLLPLQDSLQSNKAINVTPKLSPQRTVLHSPNESKDQSPPLDEKLKPKKKVDASDQNCLATKLVTIHPRLVQPPTKNGFLGKEEKGPKLIFDVTSDDGFKSSSTSMVELFANICDSVQEMRAAFKIPSLPVSRGGHHVLGMQNHSLQHCLEQLRGVEQCLRYKCKYYTKESDKGEDDLVGAVKENLTGCARTEKFVDRKEHDMFAWLASRHRRLPKMHEAAEEFAMSNRRANSLPMAMRYRILRDTSKLYVGVYRSKIHGKGLFCLREIEMGEMVIEYAGEVIRSNLTDKREKYYTDKGIGCYMFRIDDHFVVDATMKGNAARFINHSCEPNCYSKVVDILGKKHIVIFALRRINIMEELTYDYKFPFEDEKISCHCLSKKCRKYLN